MRFLTHNIGWKLISLIAAFGVWMNIASEPELSTMLTAPVEFKNYPKNLDISSNNIVGTIEVEARGPSGQLRNLSEAHLSAIVDFASVKVPGERTFTLTARELKLPRGISLIRTIPAQLRFNFDRRATRALKVRVRFSGALPTGLAIVGFDVNPPELRIAGPAGRVAATPEALSDPFDLSRVTADTTETLSVYMPEPQIRFLEAPRVTVNIHVKQNH